MRTPLPFVVAVIAIGGLLTVASVATASPAEAATAGDCTTANTVASPDTAADIQLLLDDALVPVICVSGEIALDARLQYGRDVTMFGLPGAVLRAVPDGASITHGILISSAPSTLTVQGIRFTGGRELLGFGGAIMGDTVAISDSTFDDNQAGRGGALAASAATVQRSTFTGNSAERGGAYYGGDSSFSSTTFDSNSSSGYGGAIVTSTLTLDSSTFVGNAAVSSSGAAAASNVVVANSTFVGNTVSDVTGFGATLTISGGIVQQSTFRDNLIDKPSGGQAIWSNGNALIELRGNIFADNTRTEIAIDGAAPATDLGGNLFTTDLATENYLDAAVAVFDPSTRFGLTTASLFGASVLADNGGAVRTIALPSTSVAVDAVPGASTVTSDARGLPRSLPNDSGAYEYIAPVAAATLAASGDESSLLLGLAAAMAGLGVWLLWSRRQRCLALAHANR